MAKIIALTLLFLVLTGGVVCAHRPIFLARETVEPYTITKPEISQAIYRELIPGQVDYYRFTVSQGGLDFFTQLLVPARGPDRDFRPSLALLGPGLPPVEGNLPLAVPTGWGAVIMDWEDKGTFFEPFTQTRYYMAREQRRSLPQGEWQLAVFHPRGKGGRYTLTLGEEEQWSWKDIFRFQGMWLRTRWWYSPSQTVVIILAGLGLVSLAIWLAVRYLAMRM